MKKLLCLVLAGLLVLSLGVSALAEASDPLLGRWIPTEDDSTQIPEEVLTAFTKATEELTGCDYMPVALLATQLVAGTNYCLLCQTRLVTPEAPVGYALVYLYAALDGSTSLLKVQEIEFSAFDTLD